MIVISSIAEMAKLNFGSCVSSRGAPTLGCENFHTYIKCEV